MTRLSYIKCIAIAIITSVVLNGCQSNIRHSDGPPSHFVNVNYIPNAVPKYEPKSRYGNPKSYVVFGKRYYVLKTAVGYRKRGIASWYGKKFHGRLTSTREPYNMLAMTAASPVLPLPCFAQVTNLSNGRSVIVKINDRGPFAPNRIIDLSYAAAKKLDMIRHGTALVEVRTITPGQKIATPKLNHQPHIYLQLGAFRDKNNAARLQQKLQTNAPEPLRIVTARKSYYSIYLVQMGPLKGVGEADKLKQQLTDAGYKAMTVIN